MRAGDRPARPGLVWVGLAFILVAAAVAYGLLAKVAGWLWP